MEKTQKLIQKKGSYSAQTTLSTGSSAVTGFFFGCKKVPYDSKIDALTAVATLLRYEEDADWMCFRAYFCSKCQHYHLTKANLNGC